MARQETVLSVFVASPGDVDDERNRLEEVIRELNSTWSRELGIRLDLVRWETHAFPGLGEDAQAVINDQIPDDCDIFIGLMWFRFGTPTGRAGSGTEEEFNRAKVRYDSDNNSVKIMVYFKDEPAPIAPAKLDYGQIARVAKFRESLGNEGGLYWSFQALDEFEKLVRLHLTRQVQQYKHKSSSVKDLSQTAVARQVENKSIDEDELGFLDLLEQFDDELQIVSQVTQNIAEATDEIGKKMTDRSLEIKEFSSGADSGDRKVAKRLLAHAASDMDQYTYRMESEFPLFKEHLSKGFTALTGAAAISIDFSSDDAALDQARENISSVRELRKSMQRAESQMMEFEVSVKELPRLTTVLNRSKASMVKVIQKLQEELRSAQALAKEAEISYAAILKE